MESVVSSTTVTCLIVVAALLVIAAVVGGILAYRFWKNTAAREQKFKDELNEKDQAISQMKQQLVGLAQGLGDQGKEISNLGERTETLKSYNRTMARLIMEEQKTYLYGVAATLQSFVQKNNILVDYGLITKESARARNGQLQSLEGGMKMFADSLGHISYQEDQERLTDKKTA